MNMNAMLIRCSVLMVVAMILAFTATQQVSSAHAQVAPDHSVAQPAADDRPIELATITVRPSAADLLEAQSDSVQPSSALVKTAATETIYETLSPNMPNLRMDVPYYSFGKALRRGVKE